MKYLPQIKSYAYLILIALVIVACLTSSSFREAFIGGGILSLNGLTLILILAASNIIHIYTSRKGPQSVIIGIAAVSALSSFVLLLSLYFTSIRKYLDFATFTYLLIMLGVMLMTYTVTVRRRALRWVSFVLAIIVIYFGLMGEGVIVMPKIASDFMFNKVSTMLNINYSDIRPNIGTSYDIALAAIKGNGPFGIGLNHYSLAFNLYKPSTITTSNYYNYRTLGAASNFWTMLTDIGVLSIIFVVAGLYSIWSQIKQRVYMQGNTFEGFIYRTLFAWTVLSMLYFLFVSNTLVNIIILTVIVSATLKSIPMHNKKEARNLLLALVIIITIAMLTDALKYIASVKLTNAVSSATTINGLNDSLNKVSLPIYTSEYYNIKTLANTLAIKQLITSTSTDQAALKESFISALNTAISNADKSIALNPIDYQSYINKGLIYEYSMLLNKDDGYKAAKANYEKAVSLNPKNPEIYTMIANLEGYYGNASSSLEFAGRSVTVKPNYKNGYIQLAIIFKSMKDEPKVIQALEYALLADPTDLQVAKALADEYKIAGQEDKAAGLYAEIQKIVNAQKPPAK